MEMSNWFRSYFTHLFVIFVAGPRASSYTDGRNGWLLRLYRHGTARPGHLSRHSVGSGGPDEPCHDGL